MTVIGDGGACDDGNACTQTDTCQAGVCTGGNPVVCAASDQCHDAGACDPGTGICSNPTKADGAACDDGNACTQTDSCQAGHCVGSNPKSCDDLIVCTDDSCDPQTGACVHTPNDSCVSAVSNSSLCAFDVDAGNTTSDSDFRLIFTPDQNSPSAWKLNASNPGQFYYNLFYFGSGNETVNITLPYPFVTQGAVPIHIYSGVTTTAGDTCLVPGTEIVNSSQQVTLGSYSPQALGSTTTLSVNVPSLLPGPGFAYINMHLDYGLKGTKSYSKDASNDAIDATTLAIRIPEKQLYTFSDSTPGRDTIESENTFKRDPGIGGLVLGGGSIPVPNVKVQIYDSSNKLVATVYTDQDGWYLWEYKYTGKAATFTVKLPAYNLSQSVTLKSNGFLTVNFTLP